MSQSKSGGCLCGAVRYSVTPSAPHYHACHCNTCRSWGGPALAVEVSEITIEDESKLSFYASSEYAERGFCTTCGSHILWRMKEGGFTGVMIGTLDNADDLAFGAQFFTDQKPASYDFANETAMLTGAELMAAMAGEGG